MENKNVPVRNSIRAWRYVAVVALFSLSANTFAKGYAPVAVVTPTGVSVAVRANAEANAVLSTVGNNVQVTSSVIANIARGVSVEAVVTGAVSGAALAGAWGAALGAIGAVAIGAIPAILAWQDRAGVKVNPDGSFTANDSSVCTVAPCPFFYGRNQHGATVLTGSAAATCALMVADYQNGGFTLQSPRVSAGSCVADLIDGSGGNRGVYTVGVIYEGSGAPIPSPYVAVSKAQAVDKMSAASPTASEVQALVDLNFPPEVAPVSITGPSSVQGGNTVKLGLDGSQSTESCKFYLDYFPSNIKAHPECTTVVSTPAKTETKQVATVNPDGTTSMQTVSTTTPASSSTEVVTKDKIDEKDKSKDDCEAHPERVGCAELDTPTLQIPKRTDSLTFTPESPFGDGSCPADLSVNIGLLKHSVKVWDWQKTCELALPLRALILSLATFAALLIVMPGGAKS